MQKNSIQSSLGALRNGESSLKTKIASCDNNIAEQQKIIAHYTTEIEDHNERIASIGEDMAQSTVGKLSRAEQSELDSLLEEVKSNEKTLLEKSSRRLQIEHELKKASLALE